MHKPLFLYCLTVGLPARYLRNLLRLLFPLPCGSAPAERVGHTHGRHSTRRRETQTWNHNPEPSHLTSPHLTSQAPNPTPASKRRKSRRSPPTQASTKIRNGEEEAPNERKTRHATPNPKVTTTQITTPRRKRRKVKGLVPLTAITKKEATVEEEGGGRAVIGKGDRGDDHRE